MSRERELTSDELMKWGDCPACGAKDGEYCSALVGMQLGVRVDGRRMEDGDGAHLARWKKAPRRVKEVPA
jgi:hypothetical protein